VALQARSAKRVCAAAAAAVRHRGRHGFQADAAGVWRLCLGLGHCDASSELRRGG
jgi:hypothetical protein